MTYTRMYLFLLFALISQSGYAQRNIPREMGLTVPSTTQLGIPDSEIKEGDVLSTNTVSMVVARLEFPDDDVKLKVLGDILSLVYGFDREMKARTDFWKDAAGKEHASSAYRPGYSAYLSARGSLAGRMMSTLTGLLASNNAQVRQAAIRVLSAIGMGADENSGRDSRIYRILLRYTVKHREDADFCEVLDAVSWERFWRHAGYFAKDATLNGCINDEKYTHEFRNKLTNILKAQHAAVQTPVPLPDNMYEEDLCEVVHSLAVEEHGAKYPEATAACLNSGERARTLLALQSNGVTPETYVVVRPILMKLFEGKDYRAESEQILSAHADNELRTYLAQKKAERAKKRVVAAGVFRITTVILLVLCVWWFYKSDFYARMLLSPVGIMLLAMSVTSGEVVRSTNESVETVFGFFLNSVGMWVFFGLFILLPGVFVLWGILMTVRWVKNRRGGGS